MKTINIELFDRSFTWQLLNNAANLSVRNGDQSANDSANEATSKREIENAETALRKLCDSELHDLGISRGEIAYVVRHGRHGFDPDPDPAAGMQAA